jgi:hypothetical protein
MANPLAIVIDILVFLVAATWSTIKFVGIKLIEFFLALAEVSSNNFLSLIIASVVGGVVIYFILKFLFKTTKSFVLILILYILVIIFIIGVLT